MMDGRSESQEHGERFVGTSGRHRQPAGRSPRASLAWGRQHRYIAGRATCRAVCEERAGEKGHPSRLSRDHRGHDRRIDLHDPLDLRPARRDPKVHPAWTGDRSRLVERGGQVDKFNRRFSSFRRKKQAEAGS
jgi:hypothetical protein